MPSPSHPAPRGHTALAPAPNRWDAELAADGCTPAVACTCSGAARLLEAGFDPVPFARQWVLAAQQRQVSARRQVGQMNILQRIVLKGLRAADKNIFDHFLPAIFRQEDNVTMAGHLANASTQQASKSNSSIGRSWAPAKRKLLDAGFACIACT